jgi:hypothetical protein
MNGAFHAFPAPEVKPAATPLQGIEVAVAGVTLSDPAPTPLQGIEVAVAGVTLSDPAPAPLQGFEDVVAVMVGTY